MGNLVDIARTLIGIRSRRRLAEPGPPPASGALIQFAGVRMRVTSAPSEEFWAWLVLFGWRECTYPNDRRRYLDLPDEAYLRLAERRGASREAVYHQLMQPLRQR